jgi:hypothetical protein
MVRFLCSAGNLCRGGQQVRIDCRGGYLSVICLLCLWGDCVMALQSSGVGFDRRVLYGLCVMATICGTASATDVHDCHCSVAIAADTDLPAHDVHCLAGRGVTGYIPRQNTSSERMSRIVLYFPTQAEYVVVVNGKRHRVTGSQMELTTSVASRQGTRVTLEVRRVRHVEEQLLQAAEQTKAGKADDYEVGTERLKIAVVQGVASGDSSVSTELANGQTEFRLVGRQFLQIRVEE